MPSRSPFGRATWRADAAIIWLSAPSAVAAAFGWYLGWLEDLGVAVSFLIALAAFPLAFLSCVLMRHYRDIGRTIGGFFGHQTETAAPVDPTAAQAPADVGDALIATHKQMLAQQADGIERLEAIVEQRNEDIVGIQREFKRLTDRVLVLSGAQIEACRALVIQSLQGDPPEPLDKPDESKPAEMERFIHLVNSYIDDVQKTAHGAQLWDHGEFVERLREAEHSGDTVFRDTHRGQNLSTEEFARRRRYAIAVEKLRVTQNYLRGRGRAARAFQASALPHLLAAEDFDLEKPEGKS